MKERDVKKAHAYWWHVRKSPTRFHLERQRQVPALVVHTKYMALL